MTVRLYDTKAQALRDFVPLDPENVTIYVCGPTVQSGPHIGHLRGALSFDILRRWLEHRHGRVTFVRNVTDIDDKVLVNATAQEPWWALAYRMELEFSRAYAAIGIRPPTYEPRATASIPQMLELIARLDRRGARVSPPAGDVYFDVRSWPSYGELTRQSLDAMEPAEDADPRGKRDPRDFALWKGAKEGEPASATWDSPWGAGRPGWHIECSAMSRRYLGAGVRHPRRRTRPALPAPRERAGAVGRGGRRLRAVLGAQRARHGRRPEDVQVARQLPARRRTCCASAIRSSSATRSPPPTTARASTSRTRRSTKRMPRSTASAASCSGRSATLQNGDEDLRVEAAVPARFAAAMDDDLGVPQALAVDPRARARRQHRPRGRRSRRSARRVHGCRDHDRHPRHRPARPGVACHRRHGRGIRPGRTRPDDDHAARRRARREGLGGSRPHPRRDRGGRHRPRRHRRRHALVSHRCGRQGKKEKSWQASLGAPAPARAARRAPPRGPGARTSAPSRVADRRPRPRTAPGTRPASARPPRSGTPRRAARAGPRARRSRVRAPRRRTTTPRW